MIEQPFTVTHHNIEQPTTLTERSTLEQYITVTLYTITQWPTIEQPTNIAVSKPLVTRRNISFTHVNTFKQ